MDIKICKTCNGTGETSHDVGTHNSEYVIEKCKRCNGTGRVIHLEYSSEIPYEDKSFGYLSEYYKADSKIIKLLRELQSFYKKLG
jgi:hypothetical protein